MEDINLKELSVRESEQVEWKANVADAEDVARTLCAFANDWPNLGGGYVVCGAHEVKDAHGFQAVEYVGLEANRLKEIEGQVLQLCRDKMSPAITPLVREIPVPDSYKRILVFVMPATPFAHVFRPRTGAERYYVRMGRETRIAQNGILRELLVRKGAVLPWDRRACKTASVNDLDLLALRDALQRMGVFSPDRGIDEYISDVRSLSALVPPLCEREPLTGTLRPRNFAMLLFGRNIQSHIPSAYTLFSIYPGDDRSEPYAERNELTTGLIEQARRLIELLDVQSYVAYDKTNRSAPNAAKYPPRALHEASINALVHRDYELDEPSRVTVFSSRVELLSPGSLPVGVSPDLLRQGKASPRWRNQALAWFMNRLQLAQGEGQGIPTILRTMKEEGCPPPTFDMDEGKVLCVLPAHPRHALMREYKSIEDAISLGQLEKAENAVQTLMESDPLNFRAVQLFAEVSRALGHADAVRRFVKSYRDKLSTLPTGVISQLADVLLNTPSPSKDDVTLARSLYIETAKGRFDEREISQIAVGLSKSGEDLEAIEFLNAQFEERPSLKDNFHLLRIRGNSYVGLAKTCSQTARKHALSPQSKRRAWDDCRRYIKLADADFKRVIDTATDDYLIDSVQKNMAFVDQLREIATPPTLRQRKRQSELRSR